MATHEKIIDVQGLKKNFQGKTAVNDVSLQVNKGEIFGFLGPNGSGKTTTIRMLCGLLIPDGGSGTCLGYDIITEAHKIKQQVGYMAQKFSLYDDLTIYENLEFIANIYGMKDVKERVKEAIDELGLAERQNQLAGQLSGGWKQRLALTAALLHNPKLLLLDEPTAGVDPKARRDFWDQVHYLATKGITTLVSTHYMDEAERCNRLTYIMKGNVLVRGTANEIIQKSKIITWQVTGENLPSLAQHIQKESGIEQVISYGQSLHVSSRSEAALVNVAEKYSKDNLWQPMPTSLEDVFINLVSNETITFPLGPEVET
ncbi:MAG: ABC transporter ATP-binding protein [Gammaproteobacteria bacterium]|nr:ABC transporter ATP-binding protein [Gammaproteobacteria bacterium]